MVETEQARPLASTSNGRSSGDDDPTSHLQKGIQRRRRIVKCCSCMVALLVTLGVLVVILTFTVFKIKDPIIQMNGISLAGAIPEPGSKSTVSLTADVSVKNPNTAMFKYSNTTTTLYIGETVVGEARGPSGQARPHRTARMNITVNIIAELLLSNINVSAGTLQLRSFSRIPGRVKMLHFIRKHIVVKMNCTVVINVLSRSIEDQKCMKRVKL